MSRKKRVLRAGCITLLVLAFLGYFAFSTFFFPPHSGRFKADIAGLIPRDVDFYFARAELESAFDGFPNFAVADQLKDNPAAEAFFGSPEWQEFQREKGIEEMLANVEKELEALPLGLDLFDIIGGEDLALAGDFAGTSAAESEWVLVGRASFWGKLAVSALKHPGLIGLDSQGIEASTSDEVTTLTGPELERPIHVTRIDDVVVAGTSRRLVDRSRELEIGGSKDSLLLAAPYADSIGSVERDDEQRDIEVQVNVHKLREQWGLQEPFLDPAAERFTPAFMARLLPVPAVRRVLGVIDFDEGVSIDLSGDFSTELMKMDQRAIYRGKGFDRDELMELARFAPADATVMVYVRGPVGTLLRMVLDSMEPAMRDNLNSMVVTSGYSGIEEVVQIFDDSLLDRMAFIARPNDWPPETKANADGQMVLSGPPNDGEEVFAWTILGWISDREPLELMRNRIGSAGPRIGLQGRDPNSNGFFINPIGGGLTVHEFWSRLIPGTGHIAVLNYGDVMMISNRYKMIGVMTANAVGQGERLADRPDFQYQVQDVLPTGTAMVWFDPDSGMDLFRTQAKRDAERRLLDSIDLVAERPGIQREVLKSKFGVNSPTQLSPEQRETLPMLVDEAAGEFRERVIEENLPREMEAVERRLTYLDGLASLLAVVRLDPKSFQLSARVVTPYEPRN